MKQFIGKSFKSMVGSRWSTYYGLSTILFFLISLSSSAQTINRAEYFFDSDPGVGNATALSVTPGASINQTHTVSTTSLVTGFHTFNARVRDNTGKWSLFTTRTFYIIPNPFSILPGINITRAEYFYDSDPGVGNGTNIPVTANPSLNITINTPTTPLTAGFHTVNVRVRDDQGRWSLFTTRTFYLMPASVLPSNLVKLEYFIDTDPGIGQATSVNVVAAPSVNQLFTLDLPVLTTGNYTLNVRAKDSNGFWSSRLSAPFTIIPCTPPTAPTASDVSRCDAGTVALSASGAIGSQIYRWYADATTSTSVATGSTFTTPSLSSNTTYFVSIFDPATCESNRTAVTATINTSPVAPSTTGASNCGSGQLTLNAIGGSNGQYRWYDVAIGGAAISGQINSSYVTPVISSTTTYYVSINNGLCESNRAPVVATIVTISKPTITSSVQAVGGTINICAGDVLTMNAPSGFANYIWSNGASTNPITITSSTATLTVQVVDGGGCASPLSDGLNIIVNPYPLAVITANGTQLTVPSGDSYQWYQNGEIVTGATNQSFEFNLLEYGKYIVDVTDNGCTSTSTEFEYLITDVETSTNGSTLYPNPVEKILTAENNPPYAINIMNTAGMIISTMHSNTRKATIDLSLFASGMYTIQLKDEKGITYHRIVKN